MKLGDGEAAGAPGACMCAMLGTMLGSTSPLVLTRSARSALQPQAMREHQIPHHSRCQVDAKWLVSKN
jgi:hypothetical protein